MTADASSTVHPLGVGQRRKLGCLGYIRVVLCDARYGVCKLRV